MVHQDFFDVHFKLYSCIFRYGYVGVDVFFLLSAYGLCHSWRNSTAASFYKKRAYRILPLYILFFIFCFLLNISGNNVSIYLKGFVLQATGLSVLQTPYTHLAQFSGEWFTPAIMVTYILFPFFFFVIEHVANRGGQKAQLLILLVSILFSVCLHGFISGNYLNRIPIIIAGILTYINMMDKNNKALTISYVFLALCAFCIMRTGLLLSLAVPLILKGISDINPPLDGRAAGIVKTIGKYSFEVYLAQSISMNLYKGDNVVAYVLVIIFATTAVAYVFNKANKLILTVIK